MIVHIKEPVNSECSTNLRAYEEKNLYLVFGDMLTCSPEQAVRAVKSSGANFVYWRPDTERTNGSRWAMYCQVEQELDLLGVKTINPVKHLIYAQNKTDCFDRWDLESLPHPEFFRYTTIEDFKAKLAKCGWGLPFLIRLSNSNTGKESLLVLHPSEVDNALTQVEQWAAKPAFGGGIKTEKMVVRFRSTVEIEWGCHYSYRIIVAGNQVITGYARVSRHDPTDRKSWVAITGQFHEGLGDAWVHYNEKCEKYIREHPGQILAAVRSLGLNFQGLDVIVDAVTQQPLLLEVQPGFSVGYFNHPGWTPPYYNPSYPAIVEFIETNKHELYKRIPLYVERWLDKDRLFNLSFSALKKYLER